MLALAVALVLALACVYAGRRLGASDALPSAAGQILGGLLFVGSLDLLIHPPFDPSSISGQAWLAVLASGGIGRGASFILLAQMVRRHGPAALLALNVTPVAAAGLGVLLLGETITPPLAVGRPWSSLASFFLPTVRPGLTGSLRSAEPKTGCPVGARSCFGRAGPSHLVHALNHGGCALCSRTGVWGDGNR